MSRTWSMRAAVFASLAAALGCGGDGPTTPPGSDGATQLVFSPIAQQMAGVASAAHSISMGSDADALTLTDAKLVWYSNRGGKGAVFTTTWTVEGPGGSVFEITPQLDFGPRPVVGGRGRRAQDHVRRQTGESVRHL